MGIFSSTGFPKSYLAKKPVFKKIGEKICCAKYSCAFEYFPFLLPKYISVLRNVYMNLQGPRIHIRFLTPDDVGAIYVAWMNDSTVTQYLESRWSVHTVESIRIFVTAMNNSQNDYLFGIFLNETNQHIGNIKIGNIHPYHRHADVGLMIGDKTSWGKGIAFEAIELVTQYGFEQLNLHKLIAGMYEENVSSYKSFLRASYQEVGRYKQHFFLHGHFVDGILLERCRPQDYS
jgi:[ribosomal protein S5]-alanine N-acetyltransferase